MSGSSQDPQWTDLGMFAGMDRGEWKSSIDAAEFLGCPHHRMLQKIDAMFDPNAGHTRQFLKGNLQEIAYLDSQGREQRAYGMTAAGYIAALLRFGGAKGDRVREMAANALYGVTRLMCQLRV